ncbi:helix-turn-helix domain-containing protein [Ralstonia sp. Ralssp135]|uniref:helix-turn-helix domain-containing protein n=1 Tax=Ralstonia sp. Ralssp135 TaxID=3243016 RepID=UPI0039AFBB91
MLHLRKQGTHIAALQVGAAGWEVIMRAFAEHLTQAREERGMSQRELARRVGVNSETISRYERGLKEPMLKSLVALAQELDCSIDFLVGLEN